MNNNYNNYSENGRQNRIRNILKKRKQPVKGNKKIPVAHPKKSNHPEKETKYNFEDDDPTI